MNGRPCYLHVEIDAAGNRCIFRGERDTGYRILLDGPFARFYTVAEFPDHRWPKIWQALAALESLIPETEA